MSDFLPPSADDATPSAYPMAEANAEARVLALFTERLGHVDMPPGTWDTSANFTALAHRLGLDVPAPRSPRLRLAPMAARASASARWIRSLAGAVTLLAIGAGIGIQVATSRTKPATPSDFGRVYTTSPGQRANIKLTDGTRVALAPGSRLVVAPRFGARERRLTLDGEAFFYVTTAHDAPFVVQTGSVTTRVLGTAFGVRRYAADSETRVVVTSGKVTAGGTRGAVTLSAGMMGHVTDSTALALSPHDAEDAVAWVSGRLIFTDAPVPVVLETMQRWYGYAFRLADSALVRERVTATFRTGAPTETMTALEDVLDATLTFDNGVITVRSRKATGSTRRSGRRAVDAAPTRAMPLPSTGVGK